MADSGGRGAARRIARLRESYAAILDGYRELERLSRRESRLLRDGGEVADVNAILREKLSVLREIRAEEERLTGEREWWKKFRRSLPPASYRDLLSLLDAISHTIESTVALEDECRALLRNALLPAPSGPRSSADPRPLALREI